MPKHITNKIVGNAGESAACVYLKTKGHSIIGRNIRLKKGEIDILTTKDNIIHLVEVKSIKTTRFSDYTASNIDMYQPEENFSRAKICKLKALCVELQAFYPYNRGLSRYFNQMNPHLMLKDGNRGGGMSKGLESMLADKIDPVIQIDGLAVRLLFEANGLKAAKVRYFPFLA